MVGSHVIHSRIVRDESGTVWKITESHAHDVPGAMALRCLIFDSQSICRRFWKYPENWRSLADDLLLDLMSQPRPSAY
ncbi:MAG: hypothetical protein ABI446_09740 [Gemmatimonadaceae bacterium]